MWHPMCEDGCLRRQLCKDLINMRLTVSNFGRTYTRAVISAFHFFAKLLSQHRILTNQAYLIHLTSLVIARYRTHLQILIRIYSGIELPHVFLLSSSPTLASITKNTSKYCHNALGRRCWLFTNPGNSFETCSSPINIINFYIFCYHLKFAINL